MCGIFCVLNICKKDLSEISISPSPNLEKVLQARGPNYCSTWRENNFLEFRGYVLWQQGSELTKQPAISEKFILLFNGDIFDIATDKPLEISDTDWLLNRLNLCCSDNEILALFEKLKGPYSIIFYNRNTKEFYFARDSLGRNSLLIEKIGDTLRILSNSYVQSTEVSKCQELKPLGLFKIDLNQADCIQLYPWTNFDGQYVTEIEEFFELPFIINKDAIDCQWLKFSSKSSEFHYNFYETVKSLKFEECNLLMLLQNSEIMECVEKLLKLLDMSVKSRVRSCPSCCSDCISKINFDNCFHSKIGILFSGGIDCTILAALANYHCDSKVSIDLINVAFEPFSNKISHHNYEVPDRISAKASYVELKFLYPERKWNFVEVNVSRKELEENLNKIIKHLIFPLETVLDESLGAAFWFAARGYGLCENINYKSPTRVILLGSGADELFGGYSRHRNAYRRTQGELKEKNYQVKIELEMDWKRLPSRNLGRDDRVIGNHGKTARSPYIEENFITFVNNLLPEQKSCYDLAEGFGDKLLLRLCAEKLGLNCSKHLKKRAIQFGSRVANKNQNAKDISVYLKR